MTTGRRKVALESDVQPKILECLKRAGAYIEKMHASTHTSSGRPDIRGCYLGRYLAIEAKRPNGEARKLQKYRLQQIRDAGGIAIVADSVEEIQEVLNEISRVQSGGQPD
jgi:ribosomal protein S12